MGPLLKVRIGHDGTAIISGWYLDKVTLKHCFIIFVHFNFKVIAKDHLVTPLMTLGTNETLFCVYLQLWKDPMV